MLIKKLLIENFRNYQKEEIFFDDKLNVILGLNAQGKSNLLEAICYLSLASSFRTSAEMDLLNWGKEYFYLQGDVNSQKNGDFSISAAMNNEKRRKWRISDQVCRKISDIIGVFHTVIFSPEDILLIKGGPGLRRRFLNRQLSQLYPQYCTLLLRYNQVVKQRNQSLKQGVAEDILSVWNSQLTDLGSDIICYRLQAAQQLQNLVDDIHQRLSGGEKLTIQYRSPLLDPKLDQEDLSVKQQKELIEKKFRSQLYRMQQAERNRCLTLVGPHRDDLAVEINGATARNFASQGQQRSAILSLKLAELELAHQIRGEYPVLLLDDVMSELDRKRRAGLLEMMTAKTQTFITATDFDLPLTGGQKLIVEQGRIIR